MRLLIAISPLLLLILACGTSPQRSVNLSSPEQPADRTPLQARIIPVNQTKTFGPLDLTVTNISLDKGMAAVGFRLKNTSKQEFNIFPDQGSLLVGSRQFDANMIVTDGNVSGEIHPGIEKIGTIGYEDKIGGIDPATIKQVDLRIPDFYDGRMNKHAVHWLIDLPQTP